MVELKDFRGKITPEADVVLEAQSRCTGKERQEIARQVLHEWALQQIAANRVLNRLLVVEGLAGDSKGARSRLESH